MDVQAATPTLATTTFTLPPAPVAPAPAGSAAASLPGFPAGGSLPSGSSGAGSGGATDATPGLALLPPLAGTPDAKSGAGSLPSNVAKLYGAAADSTTVSFQPAAGSNEIVTVITDKQSGKVVAQFPSETLVALAQFFQKLDSSAADNGAVVDKKV